VRRLGPHIDGRAVEETGAGASDICDRSTGSTIATVTRAGVDEFGALHIAFNNAGIMHPDDGDAVGTEERIWDLTMGINAKGVFLGCKYEIPAILTSGGGSIINMGSISWHMGMEFMPGYTTAKAAIEGLTQSLARTYGKDHIRVNCIVPGQVATPRQVKDVLTPEYKRYLMERQCLPDVIQPMDVAQLALFLGSDVSRMCTRRNFFIDAGIGA